MNFSFTYDSIIHYIQIVADIVFVWILINYIIKVAKGTQRTTQLFQGVILVLIIQSLAKYFGLTTVAWLANNIVSWGFLAIIVIFQPEIRSILERLGKSNALARISVLTSNEKERLIDELVAATANLSASKTGALITLEQGHSLNEYISTGVKLNSLVSAELLSSIFQTTTPLHDGAVIIQGDKIACASAYFPPTNMELPSRYGARHRAAIGISEVSDAVTIVVSEESGRVAITTNGRILQMNEPKLRKFLERIILNKETVTIRENIATSSESLTVDKILSEASQSDEEIEFKDENSHNKEMKTFTSASFKAEVEEAEKSLKTTSVNKNTSTGQTFIQNVVKNITGENNVPPKNNDVAKITIKTISTPKDEIREVNIDDAKVNENTDTIKTTKVIDGSAEGGNQ